MACQDRPPLAGVLSQQTMLRRHDASIHHVSLAARALEILLLNLDLTNG